MESRRSKQRHKNRNTWPCDEYAEARLQAIWMKPDRFVPRATDALAVPAWDPRLSRVLPTRVRSHAFALGRDLAENGVAHTRPTANA